MKKIAILGLVAFAATAIAGTEVVNGIEWHYSISDSVATIIGDYDTYEIDIGNDVYKDLSGTITIPSTLGGCPVTRINTSVFSGCSALTSITIPDTVTSIGDSAFEDCSGLKSITIPNSVTFIGNRAFSGCSGLKLIAIPNARTWIGDAAFSGCSGLQSITIPNATAIRSRTFSDCPDAIIDTTSIPGVKLFNKWVVGHDASLAGILNLVDVCGIADGSFSGCTVLTSITIPNSVTYIGDSAFEDCSGLKSITIPKGVTNIGNNAFYGCSGLTKITIPDSVTSIGASAFSGCSGLKLISLGNGVKSIGEEAFENCSGLTSITIPNSVTSIEHGAFSGCSGLTKITIPDSVTSVGGWLFHGCENLKKISCSTEIQYELARSGGNCPATIRKTSQGYKYATLAGRNWCLIVSIPVDAKTVPASLDGKKVISFDSANGRARGKLKLSNGISEIGGGAFNGCTELTSIVIPKSVKRIGWNAFCLQTGGEETESNVPCPLDAVHVSDLAAWCAIRFAPFVFDGDLRFGETWSDGKTTTHSFAFPLSNPISITGSLTLNGKEIRKLSIPSTVPEISDYAFLRAFRITSLTVPNNVTNIGFAAFAGCSGLSSVSLSDGLTALGDYAFSGCGKLASITVPGVRTIGKGTFRNCATLKEVVIKSGTETIEGASFVPGAWHNYWEDGDRWVEAHWDDDSPFFGCAKLQSLTIPASVTSIGEQAFASCANLKQLVLPSRFKGKTKNLGIPTGCAIRYVSDCTIRFNANGGAGAMAAKTAKPGKKVKLPANKFVRKGYKFFGWSRKPTGAVAYKDKWNGVPKNAAGKALAACETTTLYAVWAKPAYKVKFYANGGNGTMAVEKFAYGKAKRLSANKFKRKGYAFKGWAKSKALAKKGTIAYKNKKSVKNLVKNGKTVKLYAVWKKTKK